MYLWPAAGDPVAVFGGNEMLRLVQAIDAAVRQGKFQKRPIGPIGAHLSLSDERWSFAVDAAIGGCFGFFLVHSHRDLQELIVSAAPSPWDSIVLRLIGLSF